MTVAILYQAGWVIYVPLYKHDREGPRMTQANHVWVYHHLKGPKV